MSSEGGGSGKPVVWKHIGLHTHSVGTFACEEKRVAWKSAMTGNANDDTGSGTTRIVPAAKLKAAYWTVMGKTGYLRVQTTGGGDSSNPPLAHELRFDGFPEKDFDVLKDVMKRNYNLDLQQLNMSSAGTQYGLTAVGNKKLIFRHCVLDEMNEEGQAFEPRAENEMMSLDLAEVSQCVLPGTNRNEIEVQFPESDTLEQGTDQLVAIRFYVPPDIDADPSDKAADTAAELLQQKIMQTANIRKTTGDVIVSFDENKGTFLTPRGRYGIEMYDWFMRMRGAKYDYKVRYDDINRLFLLPKPDELHMAFVISLDKPIRQGQQRYQCLVLQASKEQHQVTVHLDEEAIKKDYEGLQEVMKGSVANLIAKAFKVIAKKKVFIPGKFANVNQQACVKCAVGANEGLLYPLEKQFVFIHKPTIIIRFNEVDSVEFQRYAGGQGSTRNFDLCVNLKASVTGGTDKAHTFSGIDRSDYAGLYNFLHGKKIAIKNLEGASGFMDDGISKTRAPVYNEDEIYGGPDDDPMAEDSEDEDFDEDAAAEEEKANADSSDDDLDDDELGSEIDEDLDSDLEEAQGGGSSPKKTKKKKKPAAADDSDDDGSPEKKKAKKTKKDPNMPKRGMSAFMFYSSAMREKVKKDNPDAKFGDIGKIIGAKWKALSAEDKKPYEEEAAADKKRFEREMANYTPSEGFDKKAKGGKGGKGKAKKDPNAPKKPMSSYLFFSNATRPKLKEENPELSFGELGKKLGALYKELSAEEKVKWEKKAEADKARYKKEFEAYKKSKDDGLSDADSDSDDSDSDDSDEDGKPKAKQTAKKASAKPKSKTKAAKAAAKKKEESDSDSDDISSGDDDDSDSDDSD